MTTVTPGQRQRADAAQRAQRAWSARVAGGTWAEAAELAGYSDDTAACRGVRRYFGKLPEPAHDEVRRLWRDRLEVLWRQAVRDVHEQKPGAVRAGVAIADRASRLDGLDKPAELRVYRPDSDEIMAVIGELRRHMLDGGGVKEGDIFAEIEDAEIVQDNP